MALALVACALVLFHVFLLWRRLVDATLFSPRVLLNWLAAALLLAALAWLRQRGQSVLRSRSAVIFWLLVLLLHAGPDLDPAPGLPLSVTESLPGPSFLLAAVVWAALFVLASLAVSAEAHARQSASRRAHHAAAASGFGRTVAPRPPPPVFVF